MSVDQTQYCINELDAATRGCLDGQSVEKLREWRQVVIDEIRAPSLRTLAWSNRHDRLHSRLRDITTLLKGIGVQVDLYPDLDDRIRTFAMTDAEAAYMMDGLNMLGDYYHAVPAIADLGQRFYREIVAQRQAQIELEDANGR